MIKRSVPALIVFLVPSITWGMATYEMRGHLSTRAQAYTADARENSGQRHRAEFEHLSKLNDNLSLINQLRWNYSSVYRDMSAGEELQKDDTRDFYGGENYLKVQSDSWVLQAGYQEISWGEAFGLNYADFINPKDLKETIYVDANESKLPLFLVNLKTFFTDGSWQVLYSPEPRFSKTLPLSLFTSSIAPSFNFQVRKQKTPALFKEHEWGGKFSYTLAGLDVSLFGLDYLERAPFYALEAASSTTITVQERHERIRSYGMGLAKTILDEYVVRADIVFHQDKGFNTLSSTLSGLHLSDQKSDELDMVISIDTPTYNNISTALVFASSSLKNYSEDMLRAKNEKFAIAKISYDLQEEKTFDLSYTHEFPRKGHALQTQLNWPINSNFEFRTGAEFYWGEGQSNFGRIKNISNVFFSIKNYFQL